MLDVTLYEIWIYLTAALVAASCALMGSLLLIRRMSMLGDAISHSVLLGIVTVYILFDSTQLIALLIGAALAGVATAWLSQWIHQRAKVQADASLGLVFTWFFAAAIILISVFADQIHLDADHVVFGEIAFIPFETLSLWGYELGPRTFWLALIVLLINLFILILAYPRIQLTGFQTSFALSIGVQAAFWHYLVMTQVSITAVASFDAVGAILVVALMILPAASAFLFARSLKQLLWLSVAYGQVAVILGIAIALWLDTVISASIAVAAAALLFTSLVAQQPIKRLIEHLRPNHFRVGESEHIHHGKQN